MGKNNHHKEKGIKIIDPKKIDYTFTDAAISARPDFVNGGYDINSKNVYQTFDLGSNQER
jgi:hypothetical protein